jgi:hypothetical protein
MDDRYLKIPKLIWAYMTTCKKLTGHTPLRLVYGKEVVVPLEFPVPILRVETITNMTERGAVKERLNQLMEIEEDMIMEGFHQESHKARDKAWHDRHIKRKSFKDKDLVFLYDIIFLQCPGKFRMHWLGPYEVKTVTDGGCIQLKDMAGEELKGMINGSRLKLYRASRPLNI